MKRRKFFFICLNINPELHVRRLTVHPDLAQECLHRLLVVLIDRLMKESESLMIPNVNNPDIFRKSWQIRNEILLLVVFDHFGACLSCLSDILRWGLRLISLIIIFGRQHILELLMIALWVFSGCGLRNIKYSRLISWVLSALPR